MGSRHNRADVALRAEARQGSRGRRVWARLTPAASRQTDGRGARYKARLRVRDERYGTRDAAVPLKRGARCKARLGAGISYLLLLVLASRRRLLLVLAAAGLACGAILEFPA